MMDHMAVLGAFVQSAETRSFVAAGRQIGVSASAIGKSIARLEERLGVRLFHRSTQHHPYAGRHALSRSMPPHFLRIEAAELEISQTQEAPRGKLRVSLPLVGMLLMPAIGDFVRTYPEIELDLYFTDRLVDVIDEGFDAVVRTGDMSDSRLMTRVLGTFQQRLVAAPDYLQSKGIPKRPDDLKHHACLYHKIPSSGKLERWPFHDGRSEIVIDLPTTTVVSTLEPLICLAEQGLGIACLPDFTINRQIADGLLQPVLGNYTNHAGIFRVLWPASRHPSPKLAVFVDLMAERSFLTTTK